MDGSCEKVSPELVPGQCSRTELHACRDSTRNLHDDEVGQPAVDFVEESANACDYVSAIFTLFAVVGVCALYMYSSQFDPSPTPNRRQDRSIDELRAQVASLRAKHVEQITLWEKLQKRQESLVDGAVGPDHGANAVGVGSSCCQDLRMRIDDLFAKIGDADLDAMAKELDAIKAAQMNSMKGDTCGQPCQMNMKELETVVESKVKEVKCSSDVAPSSELPLPALAADYDRTGKPDYALESAGGSIINTRCTDTYSRGYSVSKIFGIPVWWSRPSPREVLNPDVIPGRCWAMTGTQGSFVIRLAMPVVVTSVTYEHIPVQISVHGNIDSAPRDFAVYALRSEADFEGALLGRFTYDKEGRPWQTFQLPDVPSRPIQFMEVKILSNWGNPDYTCLYRWRVHGDLNRS